MSDPSFDDLLDSLDQIQAERASQPPHHHHHHEHEHEHHHKSPVIEEDIEYRSSAPVSSYKAPVSQSSYKAPVSPPSYKAPVSQPSYQASRAQPASSYAPSSSSKQGDLKQYERQAALHPSHQHGGSGSGSGSGDPNARCAKCGDSLYGTEYVTAGGKAYHQEHFTCVKCNTRLVGSYYDHHSQIHCPNCAGELMPCTKCRRGITGQYLIQEGKPYHTECVERKVCAKCNRQVEDTVLTALGKSWHTRCFACVTCGKELGTQFVAVDGHGQCDNCSTKGRPQCEKCRNPLSGEYMTFEGKSYHQDCFVCHQCKAPLGTSGFFSVNGQLKCQRCSGR